jgi:uncharacterized protein with HEPN domain
MKRDVSLYISDILTNMTEAGRFIGSMSYDEFTADRKTSYAVVRCLEIIGEAAKKVPEEIRALRPTVPWKEMAGMRDKCIHAYFGVKFRTVWEAVKDEIPPIKPLITSLLDDLRKQSGSSGQTA